MNVTSSQLAAYGRSPTGAFLPAKQQRKPRKPRGTGAVSQRKAKRLERMTGERFGIQVDIYVPIRLVNSANAREHWRVKAKRAAAERLAVNLALAGQWLPGLPVVVTITRIGKRKMDSDGLAISAKHVRDEVAAVYGVDDGSPLYDWRYAQEIGKEYGVRIRIEPAKAGEREA